MMSLSKENPPQGAPSRLAFEPLDLWLTVDDDDSDDHPSKELVDDVQEEGFCADNELQNRLEE